VEKIAALQFGLQLDPTRMRGGRPIKKTELVKDPEPDRRETSEWDNEDQEESPQKPASHRW